MTGPPRVRILAVTTVAVALAAASVAAAIHAQAAVPPTTGAGWSLAFSGFGYAVALKTGNPGAVNSMFLLFFPFLFLTTSYVPKNQLSGWLHAVAAWNPVTYLLEGLRSLVTVGWSASDLGAALLAVVIVGALSMTMCFAALRGRIRRG